MHPLSRSGAVGSALRSGRRGRVFESRLLDKIAAQRLLFLLEDKGASNTRVLISLSSNDYCWSQFPSHVFSTKRQPNGCLFCLKTKGASNTRGLYPSHSRWSFLREASSTMTAVMAERVSLIGIAHQMPSMGSVNASGNQRASGIR